MEILSEVLSSDHLNVPEEDMVFAAAILWVDKCPTRKQSFETVSHFLVSHLCLKTISGLLHLKQKGARTNTKGRCMSRIRVDLWNSLDNELKLCTSQVISFLKG